MKTIVRYGFVLAMDGKRNWINTVSDQLVTVDFKSREEQADNYCRWVKITIEEVPKEDVLKIQDDV